MPNRYLNFAPTVLVLALGCSGSSPAPAPSASGASGAGGEPSAGEGGGSPDAEPPCEVTRSDLERAMAEALDAAADDPEITHEATFTLALETESGRRFVHSHGDSSLSTSYESASTSKWVAASVILDLVDAGVLALSDEPSAYLPFWEASGVTLAQLLTFTSGFSQEPLCLNLPRADFAACVEQAYRLNRDSAAPPGTQFDYSSVHLQVAGLMAVRASGADGFASLFAAWQAKTGLFPSGAFDLPSLENPRLAGGMHWTGAEYLGFLRALYHGELLAPATRAAMLENQRGTAVVVGSPALDATGQDWGYGFGNWVECPRALGAGSFDCEAGGRNSSPGAYGAYPFIDFEHRYFGILARQGTLGTFREGDALFGVIAGDAARWAAACDR